jgi:hypothetical protein
VEADRTLCEFVGIEWVSDTVLKIEKHNFARLLGIKTIDGSLFHGHGNFPSHGFTELGLAEARVLISPQHLANVDFDRVRLLTHRTGLFRRGSTGDVVTHLKWINTRRRSPIPSLPAGFVF